MDDIFKHAGSELRRLRELAYAPDGRETRTLLFEEAEKRGKLEADNERLRAALRPFADAVYNDNGDMTVTPCGIDAYSRAYFVMRRNNEQTVKSAK